MRYFIVPHLIFKKYLIESHEYWLKLSSDHKDSSIYGFNLGFKGKQYPIDTPLAEDYEDRWDLLY